jgi:hypothetical protein
MAAPDRQLGRAAAGPRAASELRRSPTAIIVRIKLLKSTEIEQFSPDEREVS